MMRSAPLVALCVAGTLLLTALDLWTKHWAIEELSREPVVKRSAVCERDQHGRLVTQRVRTEPLVLIEDVLQLRYAENCGAAFGMLNDAPVWVRSSVFFLAAAIAIGALMWMFVRGHGGPLFAWSVPLIVSGALGNLVDRVRYGYVVDFIRYHGGFEWPTFNVADSTITVGVVLLFLDGLRKSDQRATADEPAAS